MARTLHKCTEQECYKKPNTHCYFCDIGFKPEPPFHWVYGSYYVCYTCAEHDALTLHQLGEAHE